MIKIIKPGFYGHVITCPRCSCEFSYEEEDVRYGDQRDPYAEVVCPYCAKHIDIFRIRN